MVAVQMSEEYVEYLINFTRWWRDKGASTGDVVIKLAEEAGEAAEAYLMWRGLKKDKGMTPTEFRIAEELADAATCAFVGIAMLGFDPAILLEQNMRRIKEMKLFHASA